MRTANCNSTIDKAAGLVSSLSDITFSQNVTFHQQEQLQCLHHSTNFFPLFVIFSSTV